MGTKERRAREKEQLRQQILLAARELFVNEGYENVSMRKIANKIEYSPTTIYLHFKDKADLLDSVCKETLLNLLNTPRATQKRYKRPCRDPEEKWTRLYRVRLRISTRLQTDVCHPSAVPEGFGSTRRDDWRKGIRLLACNSL